MNGRYEVVGPTITSTWNWATFVPRNPDFAELRHVGRHRVGPPYRCQRCYAHRPDHMPDCPSLSYGTDQNPPVEYE